MISGQVIDPDSNYVVSAKVTLTRAGKSLAEVAPNAEGNFLFKGVSPGPFQIKVVAEGFASQELEGELSAGRVLLFPPITLAIAVASTEVLVHVTNYDLAEEQLKMQETQRVLGVIPNFYVTYQPDALPLTPKQKFELAWKTSVDPVTFAVAAVIAGAEQAQNDFSGYGQGAQGYGKRYGATYADFLDGNMIGGAILPVLFRQDPRYFYKGSGTVRARVEYALANAVVCKGDNGHWQFNISGIAGSLAAAGISNIYYPASSRNGAGLTFQNTLIGIGSSGISNLFQEFLVRKLTPHASRKQ